MNWEFVFPLRYVLQGDNIRVERPTLDDWLDLLETRERYRSATALEKEKRLYLRLAELVEQRTDGTVALRSDWRRGAVKFANAYTPPVNYTVTLDKKHVPLAYFAREAFLIWWMLRLRAEMQARKKNASEAVNAAIQVQALVPEAESGRSVLFSDTDWRHILDEPGPSEPQRRLRVLRRRDRSLPPLHEIRPLSVDEVETASAELQSGAGQHSVSQWHIASTTFATVMNVRLSGVALLCLPSTPHFRFGTLAKPVPRRPGPPAAAFQFLTPLSRIWYGLWEDIAGVSFRICPECGRLFPASRRDKIFCSSKCQNTAKMRKWRASDPAGQRTKRPKRRTGKRKKSA